MDIRQLHSEDFRYSVPDVHPRLAVVKASIDQRAGVVAAGRAAAAVVVDQADAEAAIAADLKLREAAHALAVAAQQARLDTAAANVEEANAHVTGAQDEKASARQALTDFDDLATDAVKADGRRDTAWADRRGALLRLVDAVEQLERVQVQRRQAASTLREAETRARVSRPSTTHAGGNDPAAAQLEAHIVALHTALDKAEEDRQGEANAAQAELMTAMEDVAAADGSMADIWGRLGQVVGEDLLGRWGRGHPEPGMLAEQRNVLLVAEAGAERNLSRAANAAATAQGHHDTEAERLDQLDGPAAEPARVLEALRAWLVTVATAHASNGPAPAPVILDDTFGHLDPPARSGLIDDLVGLSAHTQILYVTDQLDVLAWAISLPHDIGGIDHVVTAGRPVLALTE